MDKDRLTAADRNDIEANLRKWERLNDVLIKAQSGLREFTRVWHRGAVSMHVRWAHRILTGLTDCYSEELWGKGAPETITDLKARWSAKLQEAWQVHLEEREDPEYGAQLRKDGRYDEHPWGTEEVEIGQWWLQQTPYQVWKVAEDIESYAAETAKDAIFDLVEGDGGRYLERLVNKRFDEALDELRKRFEVERAEQAA